MKHFIQVRDLLTLEVRNYTNLKLAATDVESPVDITLKGVYQALRRSKKEQGEQVAEVYKGYPFRIQNGTVEIDRIPVHEKKDCFMRSQDWSEEE